MTKLHSVCKNYLAKISFLIQLLIICTTLGALSQNAYAEPQYHLNIYNNAGQFLGQTDFNYNGPVLIPAITTTGSARLNGVAVSIPVRFSAANTIARYNAYTNSYDIITQLTAQYYYGGRWVTSVIPGNFNIYGNVGLGMITAYAWELDPSCYPGRCDNLYVSLRASVYRNW